MTGLPAEPPLDDGAASLICCGYCGVTGAVRFEWREKLQVRPLGSFSLAGVNMKLNGSYVAWPWAVCREELGGCGHESEGR